MAGKNYKVVLDNIEYELTAFYYGNAIILSNKNIGETLDSNNNDFYIAYILDGDDKGSVNGVFYNTLPSHTIAIYEKISNIILSWDVLKVKDNVKAECLDMEGDPFLIALFTPVKISDKTIPLSELEKTQLRAIGGDTEQPIPYHNGEETDDYAIALYAIGDDTDFAPCVYSIYNAGTYNDVRFPESGLYIMPNYGVTVEDESASYTMILEYADN